MSRQSTGFGASNHETTLPVTENVDQLQNVTGSALIGQDMWKQLKRVTIPVFSGDKSNYQNWRVAFLAGHSAAVYQAAIERLDRKFGAQ